MVDREIVLQEEMIEQDLLYSGLKDIDTVLELISVKLAISNHLLDRFDPGSPASESERPSPPEVIREKAAEAVRLLEELRGLNISEDQKDQISEAPGYGEMRDRLQEFILKGGGGFLEFRVEDERKLKTLARAILESVRKFISPDDRYQQAFKTENLPPVLRRLVNFFLPVLAREWQKDPPYGIEEGGEQLLSAERMKMPLSQAIHYLENEVLPGLHQQLEEQPGNRELQGRAALVRDKLREYKSITLRPRATPINLEKGFYTDWISQYTADGELLVTVSLPVTFRSGTNLDRMRELVQTELIRRLAGKGICSALDEDYRFRKSLDSGRRGSSRLPSFKLDVRKGFQELKKLYPALRRLEDRREFARLVDLVERSGKRTALRAIEGIIQGEERNPIQLS